MPSKHTLMVAALMAAVVSSSFGVVMTRHHVRMAFIHSEELLDERDRLQMHWENLQLEYGALRTEGRVESIARNKLGMKTPSRDEVVTLVIGGD